MSHYPKHKKPLALRVFVAAALLPLATSAADITWTGTSGNDFAAPANWSSGVRPGPSDTVRIDKASGLANGKNARLDQSLRIRSLTIDLPVYTLAATRSRTLSLEALVIGPKFAAGSIVFDGGRTPRLTIGFSPEIALRNEGGGAAGFGAAFLVGDGAATFDGPGNWSFAHNSGITRTPGKTLALHLAPSFSGNLQYAAKAPLSVDSLIIDGGTLTLARNAALTSVAPVRVNSGGALRGIGEIDADVLVAGGALLPGQSRRTPGQLALRGNLTLDSNAPGTRLVFRVAAAANDILQALSPGAGQTLALGGILSIQIASDTTKTAGARDRWVLLGDFSETRGHFTRVELTGAVESLLIRAPDSSLWRASGPGDRSWTFDEVSGILTTTIP
ncbi:hypothetical protein OPIT5_15705 [Opitutaceae bacterium TAV5]|nr:hypothetical protein OPIT5_15705 [Opitutaceae bacterium TAV5]